MNEKIKTFFAYVGGVFAAIAVFFLGVFTGKRSNNSNSGGMGTVDTELKQTSRELDELGKSQSERGTLESERERTQSERKRIDTENAELIGECQSIVAAVEKRNAEKRN